MEAIQAKDVASDLVIVNEPTSLKTKVLFLLVRLFKLFIIISIFAVILFCLFKVSSIIYDKTQVIPQDSKDDGTINVYAQKPKTEPFSTFDAGQYNFEIKTANPNELNAIVKTHIILVYNLSYEGSKNINNSSNNSMSEELSERKAQIQDLFRVILVQKTYEELREKNSIVMIKRQLINQINHILVNGKISDIYFTEWNIIPTGY